MTDTMTLCRECGGVVERQPYRDPMLGEWGHATHHDGTGRTDWANLAKWWQPPHSADPVQVQRCPECDGDGHYASGSEYGEQVIYRCRCATTKHPGWVEV